jgi:diguanylate cyclase (GGDEF)-like protein
MLQNFKTFLWTIEDRLTIRQQIGIATAALCIILAVSLAGAAAIISRDKIEAMIADRMHKAAINMSDQIDRYMFERYREVRMLADLGEFHDEWTGHPLRIRMMLERLQASVPDYAWLGFATVDGNVRASTKGMLEGVSVARRDWFIHGLEGATVEDVHEAVLLSKLLQTNANGEPHRFVDIAVPLRDADGGTLGVLGAHLNWTWSDNLRRAASIPDTDGHVTEFLILSKDGIVLLGHDVGQEDLSPARLAEIRSAGSGAFVDKDSDAAFLTGFAVTKGYRDYVSPGWIVLARRPAATALVTASQIGWTMLGLGVVAGILGVALAMLIARRATRPINTLTKEADKVGRDPSVTMLPRLRGCAEALELTGALRSLLRRASFAEDRTRAAELREAENAEQFASDIRTLRHLAETDPLTHLLNRRSFLEVAGDAMQYFKRYRRSIATFVIDIDKFKQVNDRFGHAAGDAVIKRVGEIVGMMVRGTDKAARFGGEEFVILLREIDEENARVLAERIRQAVEDAPVVFGQAEIKVSVSIGISLAVPQDRDIDDVIERADKGLYMAKNTGRNRVFMMPFVEDEMQQRVA